MTTTEAAARTNRYSLGHTPQEYERLRAQARVWEDATGRVFDQVGLKRGASCLDAGCGPGETMRLLAERVGTEGHVVGMDADTSIGILAVEMLHRTGHRQCAFRTHDLTADEPVPGAPFDLVYARLLLFHLPQRASVLARLWDAVAPGGHLVVQEYDLRTVSVLPDLPSVTEVGRVINGAFGAAGADPQIGARLAQLFDRAGVGAPDGTDVGGRIEPLSTGYRMLDSVFRSLLPAALAHRITTEDAAAATLAAIERDATRFADSPMLWPLMIAAWKQKGLS
ncbi:MAG TPA: methyltransferase domain-containing protein [Trebonia sp.]|jgi:SAM-dependent methyltransferase|nr:methyltransferase domain-containing protein [Trebonia sp.]